MNAVVKILWWKLPDNVHMNVFEVHIWRFECTCMKDCWFCVIYNFIFLTRNVGFCPCINICVLIPINSNMYTFVRILGWNRPAKVSKTSRRIYCGTYGIFIHLDVTQYRLMVAKWKSSILILKFDERAVSMIAVVLGPRHIYTALPICWHR